MAATSVLVLLTIRTSPTPTRPESVVSSTNTSSRHGVPTTVVRRSTILCAVAARGGDVTARDRRAPWAARELRGVIAWLLPPARPPRRAHSAGGCRGRWRRGARALAKAPAA